MSKVRNYFMLVIAASFILSGTSCREKTTGEKIEDSVEDVGDGIEDAADDTEDAIEDAVDDN